MARYRMTIAYEGTGFHGWQRQWATVDAAGLPLDPAGERPPMRTVQHVVEEAVRQVVREPLEVMGASRTDAGVHAKAQTAAFSCSEEGPRPPDERLARAINARLASDALIVSCERTWEDFDPIRDCLEKGYRYLIDVGEDRPLWNRRMVHHVWTMPNVEAMREAGALLVGEHDFAGFTNAGHGRVSTVRRVTGLEVSRLDERLIAIDVSGEGFLYNMVRIIAGTLLEVGQGRFGVERVREAIEGGDRRKAGVTLPPTGLCLEWMRYPARREDRPARAWEGDEE
ncbi:MAG: tRNA pseudouridine synthase A [Planctomycetota bacterium]|nr:tRNA pseudouridine synthase A [Planctomycetota bacterium]